MFFLHKFIAKNSRRNRMHLFANLLIENFDEQDVITIADFGGRPSFWKSALPYNLENKVDITCFNIETLASKSTVKFCNADVSAKGLNVGSFDVVFSNSTIEHLGNIENQITFVDNIKRTSKYFFIQAPNYWFPYEPHFKKFFFQYFPKPLQISLISKKSIGFLPKAHTRLEAEKILRSNQLVTYSDLLFLFKGEQITKEKLGPFTKSFIVTNMSQNTVN